MTNPIDPQRNVRLQAIKEIKAEYLVGSWDAFRYLNAMDFYAKLRDEADPPGPYASRPTVRQIAIMVRWVVCLAEDLLNYLAAKTSTPENLSLVTEHKVVEPARPERLLIMGVKPAPGTRSTFDRDWTFDAVAWLRQAQRPYEPSAAPKELTIEVLMELAAPRDRPCLIYRPTGERVSLHQFRLEPRFRQGTPDEFWEKVETELGAARVEAVTGEEEALVALERYYQARDLVACHAILRRTRLADARETLDDCVERLPPLMRWEISDEEFVYLLDHNDLFNRMDLEQTLGRLETERRVALNVVAGQLLTMDPSASVSATVDAAIALYRGRTREAQWRYERHRDANVPLPILKSDERALRRNRYTLLALRQNRKWLIEFFSR